jgi:hypothetical protein
MSSKATRPAFASASRRQAALQSKFHDTRLASAGLQKVSSRKIVTTSQTRDQNYRGRFRGVRNVTLRRTHRVHSSADTTKSYAQRAATTPPVAQTFPQRALQNDLPSRAVQPPPLKPSASLTSRKSCPRKSHHALRLAIKTTRTTSCLATPLSIVATAFTRARAPRNRTHSELRPPSPVAPTFSQRALQNNLPRQAVQSPSTRSVHLFFAALLRSRSPTPDIAT